MQPWRRRDNRPRTNSADPALDESTHVAHEISEAEEPPIPKPIVSVHGRDVHEEDIGPEARNRKPSRRAA
jgi:hypothetical protein